ncbi:MAG: hypothetical protein BJ554DRAFT_6564 [Olpidium bornovanus]|uniref:Uncharacterized protein n=1 Tax=Olpidium bornovanus TaxID=278681 RepID=A0A8H7ZY12_9FUNG|nr:MAG: hypothetical protein BJ554DRAFT_6564 [Olpidium bornovanus]
MARDPLAFFFAPEPSSSRDARDPAAAAAAVRMARPRRKGPPACGLPSGGGPGGAPAGAGPGGGAPGTAAAPGGGGGGAGGGLPQPPALWPPSTSVCPSPSSYKTKIRLTAPVSSSALAADTLTAVINNPNADAGIPGSAASLGFEMLEYDPLAEPQPPEFALDDAPMAHPLAAGVSAATARESSAAPDRKPPAAAGQRRSQSKDGFFGARRRAVRRSSDESASTTVSGRRQSTASSGQYVAFPTSPVSSRHPSPQRDDFFAGVELLSAPARHKCPGLLSARGCTVIPEESDAAIPSIVTLCEAPFYQNRTAEVFYGKVTAFAGSVVVLACGVPRSSQLTRVRCYLQLQIRLIYPPRTYFQA